MINLWRPAVVSREQSFKLRWAPCHLGMIYFGWTLNWGLVKCQIALEIEGWRWKFSGHIRDQTRWSLFGEHSHRQAIDLRPLDEGPRRLGRLEVVMHHFAIAPKQTGERNTERHFFLSLISAFPSILFSICSFNLRLNQEKPELLQGGCERMLVFSSLSCGFHTSPAEPIPQEN